MDEDQFLYSRSCSWQGCCQEYSTTGKYGRKQDSTFFYLSKFHPTVFPSTQSFSLIYSCSADRELSSRSLLRYLSFSALFPSSSPQCAPLFYSQVLKHGERAVFVKELTFRSLDSRNLTQVNMLYQELRKRIKLRDQKAEQEKNLVVQTKLIRIKDQRVPR